MKFFSRGDHAFYNGNLVKVLSRTHRMSEPDKDLYEVRMTNSKGSQSFKVDDVDMLVSVEEAYRANGGEVAKELLERVDAAKDEYSDRVAKAISETKAHLSSLGEVTQLDIRYDHGVIHASAIFKERFELQFEVFYYDTDIYPIRMLVQGTSTLEENALYCEFLAFVGKVAGDRDHIKDLMVGDARLMELIDIRRKLDCELSTNLDAFMEDEQEKVAREISASIQNGSTTRVMVDYRIRTVDAKATTEKMVAFTDGTSKRMSNLVEKILDGTYHIVTSQE